MERKKWRKRWRRLDNTAKIFPVIANEQMSQVFRISVTLKEPVDPDILQPGAGGYSAPYQEFSGEAAPGPVLVLL